MRLLFEIDKKDYDPSGTVGIRNSVRGIIQSGNTIAMIHSRKYDYYKFPGGGIEEGETHLQTLIREVREESGLVVIPKSVKEFGYVHRVQKSGIEDIFVQDNFYYLCSITDDTVPCELDGYEADEGFTLEYITAEKAIKANKRALVTTLAGDAYNSVMVEREIRVLETLMAEQT